MPFFSRPPFEVPKKGKISLPSVTQKMHTDKNVSVQFSSVAQSCLTLRTRGLQHAKPPCPSSTPGVYSNSRPLSWWCRPTISSSVVPFNLSQHQGLFKWVSSSHQVAKVLGVSVSTSVFSMNIQDWFPLGWTGSISL